MEDKYIVTSVYDVKGEKSVYKLEYVDDLNNSITTITELTLKQVIKLYESIRHCML